MKNVMKAFTGIVIALVLSACNNFFHDLIPPDENFILSFEVDGQLGAAVISGGTVSAVVDKETDVHSIIPRIKVSNKAVLLSVTFEYVSAAFPNVNLIETAMKINMAADITSLVKELIKENRSFNVPALDIPIDFTGPVTMLVVSGQGNIRQYTVEITVDTGEPRLLNFSFGKYENAELVNDARCMINEADRTVTVSAMYPIEMDYLSYILVPSFQIQGDSLAIDDLPVVSGSTEVQFTQALGSQNKTIRVTRNGEIKDYTLTITFAEDPDTIRSITDFRFNRIENPGVAANAVASIINTDNTGTISVQVFYQGARPSTLTPRFISPGTVSVGGVRQISGSSGHDFSSQAEYRVVSRNGMYTRIYTVKVEFISLTDGAPRITAFRFSAALNGELVQDADAQISDGFILIDARYGGAYPPISLVPEFSAEGLVTVYGSVQVSGASPQDFTRQIKYTVTNPLNPLFTRDYWIQCRMIMDTSSAASITSFGFYPEDNGGLADEVIGKIDQINGKITVYAPVGSGVTTRIMSPRFTAAGQVNVEGTAQVSGVSGRVFDAPVTYTVVSANGVNSRSYVVTVRELQSTIYVDYNAFGYGDGTSWTNAFRSLKAACEAAALFPEDTPKEIWIAAGTYKPGNTADDYFPLTANTSYIGGFAGWETAKSQRNIAANAVTISGDSGGLYAKRLFAENAALNGDLSFDALQLTSASGTVNGGGIYAVLNSQGVLTITDCAFENLTASGSGGAVYVNGGGAAISNSSFYLCYGGAVYVRGTGADISNTTFSSCTGANAVQLDCSGETVLTRVTVEDSSALNFSGGGNKTLETVSVKRGVGISVENSAGNLRINNCGLTDISGNGISIGNFSGNAEINSLDLRNITGYGIYGGNSSPGRILLSGVTANAVNGSRAVSLSLTQGSIIIENSTFANNGLSLETGASGLVEVSNCDISDVTSENAIAVSGGNNVTIDSVNINGVSSGDAITVRDGNNVIIDNVNIDEVSNGRGIYISNKGIADISNTVIKNCAMNFGLNSGIYAGGGIYMNNSGSANISYTTIDTVTVTVTVTSYNPFYGGGIYHTGNGHLSVENSVIKNITIVGVTVNGGGMCLLNLGDLSISNTTIDTVTLTTNANISSQHKGGGIYRSAGSHYLSMENFVIKNITITSTSVMGGGMYIVGNHGHTDISYTTIDTVTINSSDSNHYGGIYHTGNGHLSVENSVIKNTSSGIYHNSNSGSLEVTNLELYNINRNGILCYGSGVNYFSGITAVTNIVGHAVYSQITSGSFTLADSKFNSCDVECRVTGAVSIYVTDTEIRNLPSGGIPPLFTTTESGTVTIDRVIVEGSQRGGIYAFSNNTIKIYNSTFRNCKGASFGAGIYMSGSGNKEISGTIIEDVEVTNSGGGIYCLDGSLTISGCTIKNAKASYYSGGGVYFYSDNNTKTSTMTINDTTIENVEAEMGGGICYSCPNGNLTINGCTIKNAAASRGGGMQFSSNSNVTINDTTIENVEARNGGGIYCDGRLTINGCTIKNAKTSSTGGGVYSWGGNNSTLTINNTTMELCRSEETQGAIYFSGYNTNTNNTITNSRFINCTASNSYKILNGVPFAVISNCTFTHDANLPDMAPISGSSRNLFGYGGNFENCTFNNLRVNMPPGQDYLFNRWSSYPVLSEGFFVGGSVFPNVVNLTLRNCTFNLNSGSAGILALCGGQNSSQSIEPDHLLMDGVTINNNGGQQPLIWLFNSANGTSTPGTFQFKLNNTYNGTLLNNVGAITGLSGIILLSNGAMPILVP